MLKLTGRKPFKIAALVAGAFIGLVLLVFISVRFVTGQWLGPRSVARSVVNTIKVINNRDVISNSSAGEFSNIVFLHHSTGSNLIEQGSVRERFTQAGYRFWDHGYNDQGLRDPTGRYAGYSYSVPLDNTDPDGIALIFSQPVYGLPLNTLSALLQHEVIVFKSCFAPANLIKTDQQLETYKAWYLGMRDVMDRHPDKLFIVMTAPPLNPAETNPEEAARVRQFANWLKSDEYLSGHPNVSAFDLYGYLAETNPASDDYGMLRKAYRSGSDSHPNQTANEFLVPVMADAIIHMIQDYRAITASR